MCLIFHDTISHQFDDLLRQKWFIDHVELKLAAQVRLKMGEFRAGHNCNVNGVVGLAELDDAFVRRADVIENMRKVKYTTTDETLPDMPFAREETLSIVLKSGETITHPPVTRPKGSWQKPLSDDELRDKFIDCAKIGLGQQGADSAFRRMNGIERLASLRDLPLVTRV